MCSILQFCQYWIIPWMIQLNHGSMIPPKSEKKVRSCILQVRNFFENLLFLGNLQLGTLAYIPHFECNSRLSFEWSFSSLSKQYRLVVFLKTTKNLIDPIYNKGNTDKPSKAHGRSVNIHGCKIYKVFLQLKLSILFFYKISVWISGVQKDHPGSTYLLLLLF